MTFKKTLSIVALSLCTFAYAQQNPIKCGDDYVKQTLEDAYGPNFYEQNRAEFLESVDFEAHRPGKEAEVFVIPVVIHIMYDDQVDNITYEQVKDAIRVLNRDYRRQNPDTVNTRSIFKNVAADAEIEFRLAKLDPNGNCTNGVTRTQTPLTVDARNNVKPLSNWPNNRYLNVWVVKSIDNQGQNGTILGYAYKPTNNITQNYVYDGIVIRNDQFGTIGTARNSYGRTLVHEAGHYLGLDHPFNGGCFQGDGCADTPPVLEASHGCDLTANTCSNDSPDLPDQIENYMDYADDECTNMFTLDQRSIMRSALTTYNQRGHLLSAANKMATGINPGQNLPCVPEPVFDTDKKVICEGQSIQFVDETAIGNIDTYQWTFVGGTPNSSTDASPNVTYNSAGSYEVILTATNNSGSQTVTKTNYITVREPQSSININAFFDDFEMFSIPNNNWSVNQGLDTSAFKTTEIAASVGQRSVKLANYFALVAEVDYITSPSIDLSGAATAQLKFDYAFAETSQSNLDKLNIYISTDCGQNWNLESARLGPLLRTVSGKIDSNWTPGNGDWNTATIDLTDFCGAPENIQIKFEFVNGGGNNFYLDEVNVSSTIGVAENDAKSLRIFPNPARETVIVEFAKSTTAQIKITDMSGRLVASQNLKDQTTTTINVANFSSGIYLLQIENEGELKIEKLIIE